MTASARRIWRTVSIVLMVPGLAVWIYSGTIWNQYIHTLPRTPDQAIGRMYPRNIHGVVVFQTRAERLRLDLTQDIAIGTFFLGLLIGAIEDRYWPRTAGKNLPSMPKEWRQR
jgi:hypothetical protein